MFYNICVMSRLPQTASRKSTSSLEVCTYMCNLFSRDGSIPFTRLIDEAAFTNGCVTQRTTRDSWEIIRRKTLDFQKDFNV